MGHCKSINERKCDDYVYNLRSYIFAFSLSTLYVTQSIAQLIVDLGLNKWVLFFYINIFLLIAGFFLPPVAVIVMTSAIFVADNY